MKVHLRKVSASMLQAEPDAIDYLEAIKVGTVLSCDLARSRSYPFLRKYFALLHLAFDYWEPDPSASVFKGEPIQKNFDRFRDDVQIVAGFGEPVWNLRGELRLQSKSISFGKMSEEEFGNLYNAVLDVLLSRVLKSKGFTKESVETLVDQLISFT